MIGDPAHKLDHFVVLMFENRSFDHLLGALYRPEEGRAFEGVLARPHSNTIPSDAIDADRGSVPAHPAQNMHTPDPDPGEEYPHVNTQLFNSVSPPSNRAKEIDDMQAPFNSPEGVSSVPSMTGFVSDYINSFQLELGHPPSYDEYAQIMAYYTPDQVPVVSSLARGFAVFDHWFCEVPTQTYPNRSFLHAASSSGFVLNGPPGKFESQNDAPTVFERINAAGRSWRVYIDPLQLVPATALIHARRLAPFFATHFATIDDFYEDAKQGTLPDYSFIEPNMLHPHTDMHPPGAARLRHDLRIPHGNSMIGGEHLLSGVYEAVRTSVSTDGSNWSNTLLLITFDEHGGTFDHVPPPAVPPPDPTAGPGEQGFRFDRSGVRIPTFAISAWVDPGTIVNSPFRTTSVITTLRNRWALGGPLTQRDASAPDIAPILSRSTPRPPEAWPNVASSGVRRVQELLLDLERPLARLEKALVGEALAHEARAGNVTLRAEVRGLTRRDAMHHLTRIRDSMFPRLVGQKPK